MYHSLVFYNNFGNGDLFESREFIKEIMNKIPAENYYYCHGRNPKMFSDIDNLKYNPIDSRMKSTSPFIKMDNMLFINTWIGHNSKYVLPKVGCVIDKNYEMFNDILSKSGHDKLEKPFLDYLPTIDFSKIDVKNVDKFLKSNKKNKILICNGIVNSAQAENFSFDDVIYRLSILYPKTTFIVTKPLTIKPNNVVFTDDITRSKDGFDLNQISYLANHVDIIIGRKSGPFVFSHTKDVWYSDKKSLSFTYAKHSSHFVQSDDLPLRKYWSDKTTTDDVVERIIEVIND